MTRPQATARLFVAVDPPPQVCERLAAWARLAVRELGLRHDESSRVRLLEPELMHLTLCFLGERPLAEVESIAAALAECAAPVGELHVGAPLWLPPRRPRTLAVEVRDEDGADPAESLAALHDGLCRALARACGHREERRRFRAHITLARLRGERRSSYSLDRALPATPALSFRPSEIVLYRSHLTPEGASYEALAACTLVPF